MTKLSSALLGAALIVGGCCPPKKADTATAVVTPPTPDAGPTSAPPTPSEAAQAEVARLFEPGRQFVESGFEVAEDGVAALQRVPLLPLQHVGQR